MYQILLEFYSGDSLISEPVKQSIIDTIPQNTLFYILLALLLMYFAYVLFFFIMPLTKKNPVELFNQYKEIRKKVEDVDELYSNKKLSYADYVSPQFESAKEYERIIALLVKYPEYKTKIASYNLVAATSKEIVGDAKIQKQINVTERERQKKIEALYTLLLPKAKYYTEDEIRLAIKDEDFSRDIAIAVIDKIKDTGVVFGSQVELKTNRVAEFINTLFASKSNTVDIDKELVERNKRRLIAEKMDDKKALAIENAKKKLSQVKDVSVTKPPIVTTTSPKPKGEIIDIKEVVESSKERSNQLEPIIDFYKIEERRSVAKKKKGGIVAAIRVLFHGNQQEKEIHSVDEINDIFKEIDKSLRERKI